ncbi:hypothetical protein HanIR_Chr16g0822581 [Helianthus annuus]|nr:hypothetical protein HanIR_Chr16g0822581 [Helianthus annuus]
MTPPHTDLRGVISHELGRVMEIYINPSLHITLAFLFFFFFHLSHNRIKRVM